MSIAPIQPKSKQRQRCRTDECEGGAVVQGVCAECIFVEIIDEDPMICSRCFRRKWRPETVTSFDRRHVHDGNYDWVVRDGAWVLEGENWIRTPGTEREMPPPAISRRAPDRSGHAHPLDHDRPQEKTVCECGDFDTARRPTLSRELAVRSAERISERLDEFRIEHDPALLVAIVEKAKSRSALAGKDRDNFAKAVAYAVRQATN